MFAIRVTYLMGRVYSAVFDDGDYKVEAEWPPHPSTAVFRLGFGMGRWRRGGRTDVRA